MNTKGRRPFYTYISMKQLYKDILDGMSDSGISINLNRDDNVLIIDGLNTFIRAWTTSPAMNDDGDHVGGVLGFLNSMAYQIRMFNPTRVIIVFDGKGGSNSRKKIFSGYKSERGKNRFRVNRQYADMMTPEEEQLSMKQQFIWLNDILNYLPLVTMIYDEIEADDVIAYLSHTVFKNKVIIVSADKDFLQLVDERVSVFSPTKKKHYTRQQVYDEYNIWPQNFLLYRMLDGDASDNIPGVKGIGQKTILKRFPELTLDSDITIELFYDIAESRRKSAKIFETVLSSKDQLETNRKLMQLSESNISSDTKIKILDRCNEVISPIVKLNLIRVIKKYKMLGLWKDINIWSQSSFANLKTE